MRKPKPSLYLRFRQPDGKQSSYCRAIFDGKSRLRPFWCLVRGTEEHHPEATYYQRTKRDGKGAWESLGTDPAAAWNKATVGKSVDTCKQELAAQRTPPEPAVITDISFEDSGALIVSPVAHVPSLNRMGVATDRIVNVGIFTEGQKQFLDYHRESVLLQARH